MPEYLLAKIDRHLGALPVEQIQEICLWNRFEISGGGSRSEDLIGLAIYRDQVIPLVDARSLLKCETFRQRLAELRQFMNDRIQDHLAWIESLAESVQKGTPFTKARSPHECAFGKWVDGLKADPERMRALTNDHRAVQAVFNQLDEPHSQFHEVAQLALDLRDAGNPAGARDLVEQTKQIQCAKLKALFEELIKQHARAHEPKVVVYQWEGRMAGLVIDDVVALRKLSEFVPLEDTISAASRPPYVIGTANLAEDSIALILDPQVMIHLAGAAEVIEDLELSAA